jgi:hypothetical protein
VREIPSRMVVGEKREDGGKRIDLDGYVDTLI